MMSICSDDLSPTLFGISFFSMVPPAPENPVTGLFLTQFRTSTPGFLIRSLCWGSTENPEIIGWSLKRERERERSAVHLSEDYPLKGKDGGGDGGEKEEKKDVLKRWI